jgi:hypothetical protein
VVDSTYVEVTTIVECAGHWVTVGAQLVTENSAVVHTMEVVTWGLLVGKEISGALDVPLYKDNRVVVKLGIGSG